MSEKKLSGLNVVAFEARHAKTISDLIFIQGGNPISAPSMKEVPLENNPQIFEFAEKWFAGKIDILILLTGVGTRALAEILKTKFSQEEIMSQFKKTILIPRGPKPIRVLKEWGVPYAVTVPEPNTWRELLKTMDENAVRLQNKTVAVQEYGVPNPELMDGLKQRGANVIQVPVYRWALPDDLGPLKAAIQKILKGEAQVAVFTTAVQIEHVFDVGARLIAPARIQEALNKMVVASVGPDCSEALRARGIQVDIEPESPKMGPLIVAVAEKSRRILDAKRNSGK